MKLNLPGLQQLLATHVCEVTFVRRKNKPGYSQGRRMLCTNNYPLLNSPPGRIALNLYFFRWNNSKLSQQTLELALKQGQ